MFDLLRERSPLPLISIVETARAAAIGRGLRRLGLFGTQYTMQSSLYPDAFAAAGLEIVRPNVDEQAVIRQRCMTELVPGRFDALILGGTELSMLFSAPEEAPVPLLDTAAVHVEAILQHMLD